MTAQPNSLHAPQYPIRVVVRRTGINASVLRAWERRYGAVEPDRSDGGQRLYSEADIRKLTLLRKVVDLGFPIGQVAESDEDSLRELLLRSRPSPEGPQAGSVSSAEGPLSPASAQRGVGVESPVSGQVGDLSSATPDGVTGAASGPEVAVHQCGSLDRFLKVGIEAVHEMDTRKLDDLLHRASLTLTSGELTDGLLVPLLARIGLLWRQGEVGPASEHIASGVVRRFLDGLLDRLGGRSQGPVLLTGTPAGQRHEFGALLAGVVAAAEGWNVITLGADLPAAEIAEVARRKGARAIAMSALHPEPGSHVLDELLELRGRLPAQVEVLVGGPAAYRFRHELDENGVLYLQDMDGLRGRLRVLGA
ncbi:MAG: MerR family transcriptional regulator [Gemmatimonadales bacterium]|nr:MAG: MerR family transcriptional regulator [Gemmatimonadales bacterium]